MRFVRSTVKYFHSQKDLDAPTFWIRTNFNLIHFKILYTLWWGMACRRQIRITTPLTVFSIIIFTLHTLVINKIFQAARALRRVDLKEEHIDHFLPSNGSAAPLFRSITRSPFQYIPKAVWTEIFNQDWGFGPLRVKE